MWRAGLISSSLLSRTSGCSSCVKAGHGERGWGDFVSAMHVIAWLFHAYMSAEYTSASVDGYSAVTWMVYGYVWNFISSTMTAVGMAMSSQPLSSAREWLCIWRCRVSAISSGRGRLHRATVPTLVEFLSMLMNSKSVASGLRPPSSASFPWLSSHRLHKWRTCGK